ncbi:MAG TPA: TonB-dependent receptor, partial [Steroidobacteraceae bacterium]
LQFSSRTSAARSELDWTHQLAHGSLDVKTSASLTDRNAFTTFDGYDDQQELALLRTVLGHTRDATVSLKGKLTIEVSDTNSLAYGWDGDYTHRQENRLQNDITPTGLAPDNLDDAYIAAVARFAMFAQDELQVLPRLTAYYGIRWEGLDTKTTGNTIDIVHNRSGVWSPVLQLAWKPSEAGKTELDAALSRTYKAPTTAELVPRRFFSDINTQVTPDTQGNPNLRPELAWGVDVSATRPIEDDGTVAVRAFLRKIDNVILQNIINNNQDGRWVSFPVNNGGARVTGLSLESKINLRSVYTHAPPVNLSFSVERTWSRVDALPGPNNLVARELPFSATIGIDYAPTKKVAFGTSLAYQGTSLTQLSDTQAAYSGVVRNVDFYGTWKFTAKGQLRLSVKNVLHQDRLKYSSFIDATDTIYGYYATPSYTIGRVTVELAF